MRIRFGDNIGREKDDIIIKETPFDGAFCYRKDDELKAEFVYSNSAPDHNGIMSCLEQLKRTYIIAFIVMIPLLLAGLIVLAVCFKLKSGFLFPCIWFPLVLLICVPIAIVPFCIYKKYAKYKYTAYPPTQQADNTEETEE